MLIFPGALKTALLHWRKQSPANGL